MKNNRLVSIIVPVYNGELHLRECVDSLIMQTYTNIEILLIDDGSKDGSPSICDDYQANDSRIKVFHNLNSGVSCARNCGIDNATGDYIMFVDCDDYLLKDSVELLTSEAVLKASDLVIGKFVRLYDKLANYNETSLPLYIEQKEEFISHVLKCGTYVYDNGDTNTDNIFGSVCRTLFCAEIIRRNSLSFNEQVVLQEDMLFLLSYYVFAHSPTYLDKPVYVYRFEKKQSCFDYKIKHYISEVKLNGELLSFIENNIQDNLLKNDLMHNINSKYICTINRILISNPKAIDTLIKKDKQYLSCKKDKYCLKFETSNSNKIINKLINFKMLWLLRIIKKIKAKGNLSKKING